MFKQKTAKEQQSLYLEADLIAAIRGIADQHDTSISDVANEFLRVALELHRAENVMLHRVRVLEESLPQDLIDPDPTHQIFGGKDPILVITDRKWDPAEFANMT